MIEKVTLRPLVAAAALAAFVATTACSGGGGGTTSPTLPVTPTTAPAAPQGETTAVFTIKWPVPGAAPAARGHRAPAYLSDATASVTIAFSSTPATAGATPTPTMTVTVANPNLTLTPGGTTAPTQTTTVPIVVVPGVATFTVSAYDTSSRLLGNNSPPMPVTITKGIANPINIALNGNLASVACTAVAPTDTAIGTSGTAFMQVGIAGNLILTPKDPDGYTIVTPGTIPNLSLMPASPAEPASATPTSTLNEFTTKVTPVGTAEAFMASGTDLVGQTHSSTCTITRDAAMYVTNVAKAETAGQQSISIYDATVFAAAGTTAQAPVATIAAPAGKAGTPGDNTAISQPQYLAVDANGYLFVTNQGPLPGAPYGPTSGYVAIYAPGSGQNGNVAPVAYIKGLNRPEGIAFDSAGTLYVLDGDSIFEYPPAANGETAPAMASTTITGSNTDLNTCYGLAVDSTFAIYTACSDVINIFAKGASGNATAVLVELPEMTSMTFDSVSWLGIAVDGTGNYYAPAANNNEDDVYSFTAGTTNGAAATTSPMSVGFSQPMGIAIDANNAFYVTNYGSSSVDYFASTTTLMTGVADSTLSGSATGLNYPFGVTVR